MALVDAFPEPGDLRAADDLAQPAVVDVRDEQARRVRALVDRCDPHYFFGYKPTSPAHWPRTRASAPVRTVSRAREASSRAVAVERRSRPPGSNAES